ncbi:hypothetical protein [Epilithonimonas lactis]|uniref:Lipoprotein n=1 Tax=Epilithonimonas lactis TaxID=421072 RepID=A0A085BEJ9_9FLAO|nr:hypothetical protein [Epilithonimonas lactis]KFC20894.1 hypothetical protein IO89_11690 [Epilithonimonas lactis]SEP65275.1 hypothetical protein SAMN04488097_0215 [Epilithonimonas lactis]
MKRIGFLILIFSVISCSNKYKNYYNLHRLKPKDFETKTSISNKNKDLIYIYSFNNNILNKEINGFESLTFNKIMGEKIYIKTEERNRKKYTFSNNSSMYFREFDFILQNYLDGNLEYLLSLEDSFSSSEVGSYFYIFDFEKHKVYKINAIAFDNKGKLIQ